MHRAAARHWGLEPGLDFLNHGSFGACPLAVLEEQERLRRELERQPVAFLARRLPGLLDRAREALAEFLGADAAGLVPVHNATTGVNTVLRSLERVLAPGDELLVTDHAYDSCRMVLDEVAARAGGRVVVVALPFPGASPEGVRERLLQAVTPRTRLALVDHVTSPTGMVLPVESIVAELAERGVDTLVDGAHAPGMLELALGRIGAAYYVGNCHKWLCAPKGAGFLHVRADRRERVRPLVVSHGLRPADAAHRFGDAFGWSGTDDPTAFLCVPAAIGHLGSLVAGGWPALIRRNRALALEARGILARRLAVEPPCPEEMIGTLVALPLPAADGVAPQSPGFADRLHEALVERHRIEAMVVSWPAPPARLLRVSAQLYNDRAQYERLGDALERELGRGGAA